MRTYKTGICKQCEEEAEIYAKSICLSCYNKNLYHKRKSDPEYIQRKREQARRDYQKRKATVLAKQREYREERPDLIRSRVRESMRKRRADFKARGMTGNEQYLFGGNRLKALERDNYTCLDCGITMAECQDAYNMPLVVHHIDGNGFNVKSVKKKNNKLSNLATLCASCHKKEHTNINGGNSPRKLGEFKTQI